MGGVCHAGRQLQLQVSGVTKGSLLLWSKMFTSNKYSLTFPLLRVAWQPLATVVDSCQKPPRSQDAGTSAVWVQFDRFDDSFPPLTDKCQTGRKLPSLERSLQIQATNGEILSTCGKKSLRAGHDSSLRVGGRVGTDRECRGLERRLLHWGTHHC